MLPTVVEHLKEYFPQQAGNILWSLLRCGMVNQSLEDRAFSQAILNGVLNQENWIPGNLARICLYQQEAMYPQFRSDARNLLLTALSRPPLDQMHSEYPNTAPIRLALSGAWAEEYLTIINEGGWEEFKQFLLIDTTDFVQHGFPEVKESLLFLSHYLNDPEQLTLSLQSHWNNVEILEFCLFCYCSFFLSNDQLSTRLFKLISRFQPSEQINALRYLLRQDRKEIALRISDRLLSERTSNCDTGTHNNGVDVLYEIADRYYLFVLLESSGRNQEAADLWKSLENEALQWHAGLFLEKSQALGNLDGLVNFQHTLELLRNNASSVNELVSEAWALSDLQEFTSVLPEDPDSVFVLAQKYRHAMSGLDREKADDLANQILAKLKKLSDQAIIRSRYLSSVSYFPILDIFIEQNDLQRAETAAALLLKISPGDAEVLSRAAVVEDKQGHLRGALDYKLLESAARPEDCMILKQLADYYERCGETGKAFQQIKKLSELEDQLNDSERLKLAELAFASGNFASVDQAASPLLNSGPHKGSALMILGKTRLQQGYSDEAVSFFRQAVEENPYLPERWVYLTNACRKDTSDEHDLLAILQEGMSYLPDSSSLHSELAKEYYLRNQISEAIECLDRAVNCIPDTREGAVTAGTLMVNMGDVRKAHEFYLEVLNYFDFDLEIIRLAALTAMEIEDFEAAEDILVSLMRRVKPGADDIALYIMARLKGQSPIFSENLSIPIEEMTVLNEKMDEGLQLDPDHLGINLLRAEMKAYLGDFVGAREIFTRLIEHDHTNHWKTLGGYGYASMKLGDLHTAMAALQESYAINPEQPKLEQYLAEVYLQSGLPADARLYADRLFFRKPNDLNTLMWYAEFNGAMGQWESVVSALINAYHLNPGDPAIMMRLAEGFVKTSRSEDAQQLIRLIKTMPDLNSKQYLHLANLSAQMDDFPSALDLLEQTLERGYTPAGHCYFAMALMHQQSGDMESALIRSQQALQETPENRYLLIYQADLQYALEQPLVALNDLERSVTMGNTGAEVISSNPFLHNLENELRIRDWLNDVQSDAGMAIRKGLYLRKLNRYTDALEEVKTGYTQTKSEELLVLLYDLSVRNAEFDLAKSLTKDCRGIVDKALKQAASVIHLRLNILLSNVDILKKILTEGSVARYNTSEWHCAQCMISQSDNNWDAAMQNFRQARTLWANKSTMQAQKNTGSINGYNLAEEILHDQPYWIWVTAAGLLLWDESLNGFDAARQSNPHHLAVQFGYLKSLTLAGEWQMLSKELELEKRKPQINKGSEEIRFLIQGLASRFGEKTQQPDIRRWMVRANILFSSKNVDVKSASEQLHMPEDLEFLAGLLRNEKRFAAAAEIAGKLSRHFTNIWQQALCYLHTDRSKAAQLLKDHMDNTVGFPVNLIVSGQIAEKNEDYPAAYQAYRKAVHIWKDEPKWLTHCAELAEMCGDEGSTVLHLKKALDLGYRKLETALKIGKIHENRSEYNRVIDILEPLYRDGCEDFSILMQLGGAYLELGDSKQAFEFAERARNLDPKSEQPYMLFAKASDFLNQHNAAMDYARKALELKPDDENVLVSLSRYIERAGNADEAFQLLENVVVGGEAGWTVIQEYVRQKRAASGAASLLAFLENLHDKGGFPDEMHAVLAEAFFENNQPEKAEREAAAAVKVNPADPKMNMMLALLNHRSGQLDLASHYAAQAIQLEPDNMDAYFELADIYQSKNDPVKALEVYNRAIKVKPENYKAYFKAGLMLRETRNYLEAETMLKQAAKFAPDDLNIRRQLSAVIALNMVHHAQEENTIP